MRGEILNSKQVVSVSDNYSQLIHNLCEISNAYFYNGEFDNAFQVLEHGENLSELRDVPAKERAKLWILYGKIEEVHSALTDYNYEFAIALLHRAERAARDSSDQLLLARAFDEIGQAYLHQTEHNGKGSFDHSKLYFEKGYALRDKSGDIRGRCMSMIHLAQAAECMDEFDIALEIFQSVKEIAEKNDFPLELSFAIRHLAKAFVREDKPDDAFPLFKRSLEIREEIGLKPFLPFSHISMGQMYDYHDNRDQAKDHYQTAFNIAEEMKATSASIEALLSLGDSYVSFQERQEAITTYTKALKYAKEAKLAQKVDLCKQRLQNIQN
ncbi:MAG: tetratricopeptide repeat protein [Candidatus Marinimicrobia bacterium]|nr:tetratricopeptide repeat protein [Candidatus Neomarinimicrobiota bacterium]